MFRLRGCLEVRMCKCWPVWVHVITVVLCSTLRMSKVMAPTRLPSQYINAFAERVGRTSSVNKSATCANPQVRTAVAKTSIGHGAWHEAVPCPALAPTSHNSITKPAWLNPAKFNVSRERSSQTPVPIGKMVWRLLLEGGAPR